MSRIFCVFCVLALAACAGSGTQSSIPVTQLPDAQNQSGTRTALSAPVVTWTVQAGASTVDQAVQDLDFYDSTITVNVGDNVQFRVAASEPHTVAFVPAGQTPPPPNSLQAITHAGGTFINGTSFSNSGLLTGGQTYTVKFVKAGTYIYRCLIHQPQMMGKVIVQNAGTPYPHTQQFYLHEGAVDEWADLSEGQASITTFPFTPFGTTLSAGISPGLAAGKPADSTVLRFLNSKNTGTLATSGNLTVKVNTTVTWVNESNNEPHTVTFLFGQPAPPSPFVPAFGGSTVDGTHPVNSGAFFPGQRVSFKFTKPGKYAYLCLFHDESGMEGIITVTS